MNDDLDEEIIGADDSFDEFSQDSTSGSSFRQSPIAKILIVLVAISVLMGVVFFFGGEEEDEIISTIPAGSEVTQVPGTSDQGVPQAYSDAVEQVNEAQLERALQQGESAIPVPVETAETRLEVPEVEEETEDPLLRWRQLQEERVERQLKSREADVEPVTVLDAEQQSEAIQQLSESMVQQMESVLTSNTEDKVFTTKTLIQYEEEDNEASGSAENGSGDGSGGFEEEDEEVVVIAAGQIYYGQTLLEANSDVPGTVLAQLVSGPLKGWRLLGEFTVLDDAEKLAIKFSTAVNEEGKQYNIDALMLNPKTTLPALRTSINRRFIRRVLLPAASGFVEGFSQAIADSGRTSVTVSGDTVIQEQEELDNDQEVALGVAEAGEEISTILDDYADVKPLIIIKAGTPIGIFFIENVVDEEAESDF